jgi:hypothetical protein
MRYSRTPPGDHPLADAWNLVVASALNDKRMAETVSERVSDWPQIAAYLATLAGVFADYVDHVAPDSEPPTELFAAFADQHGRVPA